MCQVNARFSAANVSRKSEELANEAGGIDWIAVTTARMIGWKTRSYREKPFMHNRHLGTAEQSVLASFFSYGEKDYYLGGSPIWQFFRVIYRITQRPYVVDGLALGLGYCWAMVRRIRRPVSKDLIISGVVGIGFANKSGSRVRRGNMRMNERGVGLIGHEPAEARGIDLRVRAKWRHKRHDKRRASAHQQKHQSRNTS